MCRFWQSFLSMMENLLTILYAARTGYMQLYVESINMLLSWTFAYNRHNYARFLTFHYIEMINLEENHPSIYQEFMKGNFSVQVSDNNPLGKWKADKVIETTINRDTKTPGGTTDKYFPNLYWVKRYKSIFFYQHFVLIFAAKKVWFHLLTYSLYQENFLKDTLKQTLQYRDMSSCF